MRIVHTLLLLAALAAAAGAEEAYGSRGIYPVYEADGQWLIFNRGGKKIKPDSPLALENRFLIVGSKGAGLFTVARASLVYGGACKDRKAVKLAAALLKGAREAVGSPIIGIHVPETFSLKGSRAEYLPLSSQVSEDTYKNLKDALTRSAIEDIRSGAFHFKLDDAPAPEFLQNPKPESIAMQIEFAAKIPLAGLADPFILVEGTQVMGTYRRCLRLAAGGKLIGGCIEMPRTLMAETALLKFVAYDPSGRGTSPFVLAFTPEQPLWGHERWGFLVKNSGPRSFLMDAMDLRCREAF